MTLVLQETDLMAELITPVPANFEEALGYFDQVAERAIAASIGLDGYHVQQRIGWTTYVFARLTANISTIRLLVSSGLEFGALDHCSIASVGRTTIEATVMACYLSEPNLQPDEWEFRKSILDLHDATNRYRMWKTSEKDLPRGEEKLLMKKNLKDFRSVSAEIKERIRKTKSYKSMSSEEKDKVCSGQIVYAYGIREAVRASGFSISNYEFITTYLSAFIHSHPVSFYRTIEHKISYQTISKFQEDLCYIVLIYVAEFVTVACDRMAELESRIAEYQTDMDVSKPLQGSATDGAPRL